MKGKRPKEAPCPIKKPNTPARMADAIAMAAVVGGGRSPDIKGEEVMFPLRCSGVIFFE